MPVMPGGNFVPQSVLQGGTGQSVMPQAMGTGTPNQAGNINAQQAAGPGQGGAATAQTAEAQLPAAQQAAGMQPAQPQQAPPQPGQPPAQQAPPPPQPGFQPNSQGQQLYMPGQGPVTEQVPPLADMANQPVAAEPRGHMDMPLDANAQAGQMELMASDNSSETDPFDLLGQVFEEYYNRPARSQKAATVPAGLLSGLTGTEITRLRTGNEKAGSLERVTATNSRVTGDGLLADLPRSAAVKLAGGKMGFDLEALKERRDPDGTSEVPWDKAQRDGAGTRDDDDEDEPEDPSDLEEEGDDDSTVEYPSRHESITAEPTNDGAVPYDDNGKPRPSWKEAMEYMAQLGNREFVPGEDCAHCGASMEKGEGGKCNTCGHDYDTGEKMAAGPGSIIGGAAQQVGAAGKGMAAGPQSLLGGGAKQIGAAGARSLVQSPQPGRSIMERPAKALGISNEPGALFGPPAVAQRAQTAPQASAVPSITGAVQRAQMNDVSMGRPRPSARMWGGDVGPGERFTDYQPWLEGMFADPDTALQAGIPGEASSTSPIMWQLNRGQPQPLHGQVQLGPSNYTITAPGQPTRPNGAVRSKGASVIGTHGVPMVSTSGDMQRTSAGEGDVSSLLVAPWSQNGADAWRDLHQHQGRSGGKGKTTFGGLLSTALDTMSGMNPPKQASGDMLANKAWQAAGLSPEEADREAGKGTEPPLAAVEAALDEFGKKADVLHGFLGRLEKQAMDDCYAYGCKPADNEAGCTCGGKCPACARTKSAAVHPFRPINADPDFIAANKEWFEAERAKIAARRASPFAWGDGDPVVTGFLRSMGCSVDANGQIKSAMIGDDGSTTADPFGGGMILGQQQPQDENPMDNPGTLLEAGLGDNQGSDTTAQPSDHGQHDATVAPFSNGIDVNVFKQGSFGYGFVQACQAKGLLPEFIYLAAVKSASVSETIAAELEPLTKQANPLAWGAKALQFGKSLMPWADDAARTVARAPKGPGWGAASQAAKAPIASIPRGAGWGQTGLRAQNAINHTSNALGTVANQGRNVYNAAYGARSPAFQMGARMAVGGGAGTMADINEAYSSGSYEPTFMTAGLLGGMRPGGLGRTATGAGLGYTADTLTGNQYGFTQMGALGGAGSNFLPKRGLLGAAREVTSPKAFSRLYGGGGPLSKDPILRGGQMAGAGLAAGEIASGVGQSTGYVKGLQDAGGRFTQVADVITQSAGGADPRKYTSFGPDGKPVFDQEGFMTEMMQSPKGQQLIQSVMENPENLPMIVNGAAKAMPGLMPIAEQLGAVDPNTGQIDVAKLQAGFEQFGSGGGLSGQLDKMGMGWAKPLIDFAVSNPIGMAVVGGGVLMLLGSLMGGGQGMGLLGAGAMALGAFGGLDGLAQQSGLFGGGQGGGQQPEVGERPLHQGPPAQLPADVAVQAQQQAQPPVSAQQSATGQAPPQGFDAGAALQNLLPQVQQILPDVTTEEIMGMMTQLGENADQVFDMQPQELAATIQALRQRGG